MLLAPFVLAAALGQACPEPPSRYGPPPCAASSVPGCLPGYRRVVDAHGRVTYVCDRAAQPGAPPPAPVYAQPAPPPPPPPPGPPPAYPVYGSGYAHRGLVGLVVTPGGTRLDLDRLDYGALALSLELRPPAGGGRLRFGYEYSEPMSVLDVGAKFGFLPGPVSPFLAGGVGGAYLDAPLFGLDSVHDRTWRATASVSGGVDLFLAQNFFVTLEVKRRWIFHHELDATDLHSTSFYGGVGFFF